MFWSCSVKVRSVGVCSVGSTGQSCGTTPSGLYSETSSCCHTHVPQCPSGWNNFPGSISPADSREHKALLSSLMQFWPCMEHFYIPQMVLERNIYCSQVTVSGASFPAYCCSSNTHLHSVMFLAFISSRNIQNVFRENSQGAVPMALIVLQSWREA